MYQMHKHSCVSLLMITGGAVSCVGMHKKPEPHLLGNGPRKRTARSCWLKCKPEISNQIEASGVKEYGEEYKYHRQLAGVFAGRCQQRFLAYQEWSLPRRYVVAISGSGILCIHPTHAANLAPNFLPSPFHGCFFVHCSCAFDVTIFKQDLGEVRHFLQPSLHSLPYHLSQQRGRSQHGPPG